MSVVLLDCDGVLCDFLGGLLYRINWLRQTSYKACDCAQWNIAEAYGLDWRFINGVVDAPGFCAGLAPTPGAHRGVASLREAGHELFVVTSPFDRAPHWMPERSEWLLQLFAFDKAHVVHANTKRIVHGDVLVDDKPETIIAWAERWPESKALLWDAPWNRVGVCLPDNAVRVFEWREVLHVAEGS